MHISVRAPGPVPISSNVDAISCGPSFNKLEQGLGWRDSLTAGATGRKFELSDMTTEQLVWSGKE